MKPRRRAADLALELTMRDVLAGLEEFVTLARHACPGGCLEILEILPEHEWRKGRNGSIVPFAAARRCGG